MDASAPQGRAARILQTWHKAECWIAVASFAAIAALLIIDVLGREFVGPVFKMLGLNAATGFPGAQKMAVFALVVGSYAGIGIATHTNSHLVPRVGFGWVPASWGDGINRVADIITGVMMLIVTYYAWMFVMASKSSSMRAPVLNWEVWPFQLAIAAGFLSAGLRYFFYAAWPELKAPPPEFQE